MRTLNELVPALTIPFPSHQIDLKPGATTRSKDRALAMAYADSRVYQERLDQVVGPEAWSVRFELTPQGVVCTLEICGVIKADVGDFPVEIGDRPNENRATTATAQAFKRACAQFGLGRYLYALPRMWADYDADQKAFINPQGVVTTLYQAAGLGEYLSDTSDHPAQEAPAPRANGARATDDAPRQTPANAGEMTAKLARARTALATAEANVAPLGRSASQAEASPRAVNSNGKAASEKQIRYLARLFKETPASPDELDGLAHQVGLAPDDFTNLDTLQLSAKIASTLIEELLALQALHAA